MKDSEWRITHNYNQSKMCGSWKEEKKAIIFTVLVEVHLENFE